MTPITSADLRAQGLEVDAEGTVRREGRRELPAVGTLVGIDPSLTNLGLARIDLAAGVAETKHVKLPAAREKGKVVYEPDDLMNLRLQVLRREVADFLLQLAPTSKGSTRGPTRRPYHVVVEGAALFRGGGPIDPETLAKLGTAVGAAYAAAVTWADECRWVPPDWTWRVLCGGKRGGAGKSERWSVAQTRLQWAKIDWPLPEPEEIKQRSPQEHEADALTLAVALMTTERSTP